LLTEIEFFTPKPLLPLSAQPMSPR
jgi:hypothetical protein